MREEIKAGLIVIGAMAILIISVIAIGGSKLFDSFDVYYTKLFNVTGLESGSQVKLGGMTVGRVLSISPPAKENDPILIEIGLKKGTPLYEGITASISQVGFVGDIFLQLSLSNKMGKPIKTGETIPSVEQSNFNTIMAKAEALTLSLKKLVEDVDKVFNDDNINNVSEIIKNTNKLVVSTDNRLDKLIASLKSLSEKLSVTISKAELIMDDNRDNLKQVILKAKDDMVALEGLIQSLESSSENLGNMLIKAEHLIDTQNDNLDQLFRKVIKTTETLNDAISNLNQRPWRIIYRERSQREE